MQEENSHQLIAHREKISCVAFNQDCTLAISGSGDNSVAIWDTASGHCKRLMRGHTGYVRAVALSSNGDMAISVEEAGDDNSVDSPCAKTALLWDVTAGTCLGKLPGEYGEDIDFSPSGSHLAFLPGDRIAILVKYYNQIAAWDVATRLNLCARTLTDGREDDQLIPLAVGSCSGYPYLLTGTCDKLSLTRLRDSARWIEDVAPKIKSPLFRSQRHNMGMSWNLIHDQDGGGSSRRSPHADQQSIGLNSVAISGDGKTAASCAEDCIKIWRVPTLECLQTLVAEKTRLVALSEDGKLVASENRSGTRFVWDTESGHCIRTTESHGNAFPDRWENSLAIGFGPGATHVFFGKRHNPTEAWDISSG